jgi:hypothetical protein
VICTDPLKRIKIVAETAWTVKEEDRKKMNIDYEKIEVLNVVANAFLNPSVHNEPRFGDSIVSLSWGFFPSEENFKKYIVPWYNKYNMSFWPILLRGHVKIRQSFSTIIVDKVFYDPEWSFFLDASDCLTPIGFNKLKNAFIACASPQAQQYLAELTGAVDQNTYREILGLYRKPERKGYAEKVKETAKPLETPTDENMVDS